MSTAKINLKNIDYFKFKKIVVDGGRDDYAQCSREVRALCDAVQTLTFRDEEWDAQSDLVRFEEINSFYRQILANKRIEALDMRLKSGWWGGGDKGASYSAGKIKPVVLLDTLAAKHRDWTSRHGAAVQSVTRESGRSGGGAEDAALEGPGLFVLKHREHQCYVYVGRADNVFQRCTDLLKSAYEGALSPSAPGGPSGGAPGGPAGGPPTGLAGGTEPLAALLVISAAADWDFYCVPVTAHEDERVLRVIENDLLLKHDAVWPRGLNPALCVQTPLDVAELRRSCVRHRWPPEAERADTAVPRGAPGSVEGAKVSIDLTRLRALVAASPSGAFEYSVVEVASEATGTRLKQGECVEMAKSPEGTHTSSSTKIKATPKCSSTELPQQPVLSLSDMRRGRTSALAAGSEGSCKASVPTRTGAASRPLSAGGRPAAAIAAAATARASRVKSPLPPTQSSDTGTTAREHAAPFSACKPITPNKFATPISPGNKETFVNTTSKLQMDPISSQVVEPCEEPLPSAGAGGPEAGDGSAGEDEDGLQPAPALKRSDTFTLSDSEAEVLQ